LLTGGSVPCGQLPVVGPLSKDWTGRAPGQYLLDDLERARLAHALLERAISELLEWEKCVWLRNCTEDMLHNTAVLMELFDLERDDVDNRLWTLMVKDAPPEEVFSDPKVRSSAPGQVRVQWPQKHVVKLVEQDAFATNTAPSAHGTGLVRVQPPATSEEHGVLQRARDSYGADSAVRHSQRQK